MKLVVVENVPADDVIEGRVAHVALIVVEVSQDWTLPA